jgi:hypothetical protein|nr:MAG TPA: hypothetical protein [Caudoviricetes sp.]
MIVSVGRMMRKGGGGLIWPKGLKESIKAIYDPKKQGITNFDVIESYTEDFTTWRYLDSRGIATITGSTIHITEAKSIQGIVEDNKEPYSDIKILVQGVTADNPLNVRDINGTKAVIDKDGVYEFKDNGLYFGFGFSKVGVVDVTITQLPTSILKDLSGNGNHAYLYGGKGKLNSGMGLYKVDFTSWRKSSVQTEVKPDVVKVTPNTSNYLFIQYANSVEIPSYKIKVIGLGDNVLKYQYATENGRKEINIVEGENELPTSIKVSNDYQIGYRLTPGTSVFTITQIPDYPDQLCYDGKMYAVCYDFPILTDYTVMADRTWFDNEGNRVFITKGNIWPNCAFNFEKVNASLSSETFSYSQSTNIDDLIGKSGITYQTKQSYNGKVIGVGTSSDGDILLIGGQLKGEYVGCHGKIIIADRSFTEDEITWLKDNLFRK